MTPPEMVDTTCESCGRTFSQPDDPGRKRIYCDSACRQRAYRARGGRASGTRKESDAARQKRQQREAWAEQEAKRERERQRSRQRRTPPGGRRGEQIVTPEWTWPNYADSPEKAKKRATANLLHVRANHPSTPAAEARQCQMVAEKLRATYGL